ncbi:MAG: hypothetical protein HYT81_03015 [Gemmatimonadetes bacterium]|nr:hypothetical protein [Gemmatimonadota bacterium]
MKWIVLDTSAIVNQPSTVSFTSPQATFVVPESVVAELSRIDSGSTGGPRYVPLIANAIDAGTAKVIPITPPFYQDAQLSPPAGRLLASVEQIKKEHPAVEVIVATDDHAVAAQTRTKGLATISSRELLTRYLIGAASQPGVAERAKHIVGTINVWGTFLAILLLGASLFWFRSRYGLAYGVTEVGVGIVAAARVFWPSFDYSAVTGLELLQLLAGLYVMVRGMDNIGRGIAGTRFHGSWALLFPN